MRAQQPEDNMEKKEKTGGGLFRCSGRHCPGYDWPASEMPHPYTCAVGESSLGVVRQDDQDAEAVRELVPGDRVEWRQRGRVGTVNLINSAGTERLAIVWDGTRRDSANAFDLVHRDGRAAGDAPWSTVERVADGDAP
jgi:hypothetical protein